MPGNPWEWGEWIERKVGPNCHVRIARNHYSAPERHIGRKIHARVGERMVELFLDKGGERIAVHRLKSGRNQYATEPEHMPEPTIADAVLDRIVHNAYRIDLKGESQRKRNRPPPLDGGNDK